MPKGKEAMPECGDPAGDEERRNECEACPVMVLTGLAREAETAFRDVLPSEFWQHRRAAHREALLAVRSLLDAAIERVDREPAARPQRQAKKISIA